MSTLVQSTARQLDGVDLDRVFEDKISGATRERPGLDALLGHLRVGDEVHVHSIDRLARDLRDLHDIVSDITARGASVRFHKEALTLVGDGSPIQRLQLDIMGAVSSFERAIIAERAAEGRALAKARGVRFGKRPMLSKAQARELCRRYEAGEAVKRIARDMDISPRTVHRTLEREGVTRRTATKAESSARC